MKINFLKNFVAVVALGTLSFGCGSAPDNNTEVEANDDTFNEAEVVGDEADMAVEGDIDYDNLFANAGDTENHEIMALARMNDNFSTFVRLVELSGLTPSIELAEDMTVLIPTNQAFQKMPEELFEYYVNPDNKAALARFVQRHIIASRVPLLQFQGDQILETEVEEEIAVKTDMGGNVVYVGGARIVKPDVYASNGIIHVVNAVVEPTEEVLIGE